MEITGYYSKDGVFMQFAQPVFPYVVWKPEVEVRVFEEWFSEMESQIREGEKMTEGYYDDNS